MADITMKLIWYRLGEASENMAERYGRFLVWYKNFNYRNLDIVDMFFVSWIIFGVVVAGLVHFYFKFFGRKAAQAPKTAHPTPRRRHFDAASVESCQWLNAVINWVYLNYNSTPEFVNSWLHALNEQTRKQQGAVQVRFDRILAGSLPPRVTNVHTEAGPTDNFTLHGSLDASELGFQILVSKQTTTEVQLTNCDINVQLLRGELNVQTVFAKDEVHLFVKFEGTPEIALLVKPHQKAEGAIDVPLIEEKVKSALAASVCHFRLNSSQADGPFGSAGVNDSFARAQNHVPVNSAAPPKPPRSPEALLRMDKRLLVKVIKASGLGAKDFGCNDPFCTVEMDEPHQRHNTSVVKNTVNPFWDESFLFDLNGNTREILFEVFDREKVPGEDFLGMAAVSVEELRKTPSSRHIIPLAGRQPGSGKGGNLTVEFLFMDPAEITDMQPDERDLLIATAANLSPRRRIETSKTVMPSGLVVTTQTTTTERPKVRNYDAQYYDESPNRVEKMDSLVDYSRGRSSNDSSPQSTRPLVQTPTGRPIDLPLNGTDSVVDTALRDMEKRASSQRPQTPTKSIGTVIVTKVKRATSKEPVQIPEIKVKQAPSESTIPTLMTQSTPTEELKDDGRLSSTSSDVRDKKPKRSSSIASTLRKRFSRNKKPRSHSADRADREKHLRVPDQYGSGSKSTANTYRSKGSLLTLVHILPVLPDQNNRVSDDDLSHFEGSEAQSSVFGGSQSMPTPAACAINNHSNHSNQDLDQVDIPGHNTSNLQKSKSIGSSLKKLFRMKRRHSHGPADTHGAASRDSSVTRSRDRLHHDDSSHMQPSPSPEIRRPQSACSYFISKLDYTKIETSYPPKGSEWTTWLASLHPR
ncbi:phospholipid transfer protein C2CD2L-like isoform X35 [Lineus longissimus]|uniref:phospholipid transfer protein C2CD2L-like isoform X35 n=1 Tax=Lineus longissimus TaxID=88925 RepID=UPI00315CF590